MGGGEDQTDSCHQIPWTARLPDSPSPSGSETTHPPTIMLSLQLCVKIDAEIQKPFLVSVTNVSLKDLNAAIEGLNEAV